jgi:hypothetical protein
MNAHELAYKLATQLASFPQVVAVALGGSQASRAADANSDIDLSIYTEGDVSPAAHATLIEQSGGATRADQNLPYWGGVNVWVHAPSGITVDCMYVSTGWMEEQVTRVMEQHQPSLGYTTSFCRTVQHAHRLYDPHGWFEALQARTRETYPEALRRNIIAHNHPVLRTIITSYLYQIENAVRRSDVVSVNHRVAALLASYFDIVFALNRVLHPGEKRLLAFAHRECTALPPAMETDIAAVLIAAGTASAEVIVHLTRLLDRLDELLMGAGFDVNVQHSEGA